jgi:hypothetical protein
MMITLDRMEQLEDLLLIRLSPLKRFLLTRLEPDEEDLRKIQRIQCLMDKIRNRIYPQGKSPLDIWSEGPDDLPLPSTL